MKPDQFSIRKKWKGLFLLIIPVVLGAAGFVVMSLWNAILPELTGVKAISFWQAVGLFALCKILFGNFRGPGGGARGKMGFGPGSAWEKMRNATPEEREAIREEWRRRCRK